MGRAQRLPCSALVGIKNQRTTGPKDQATKIPPINKCHLFFAGTKRGEAYQPETTMNMPSLLKDLNYQYIPVQKIHVTESSWIEFDWIKAKA